MAKRDALRQLSQTIPAPAEVETIMDTLHDRDDIHVAVMGVSIVEAILEKLIVSRLHRNDADFLPRLFQNYGPLSDFSSKILIAEAFAIITSPLAAEMQVMRSIRNAFAHAKVPISFTDKPVAQEVDKLKVLQAIRETKIKFQKEEQPWELDNKSWFLLAMRITLIMLDSIAAGQGTADSIIGAALQSQANKDAS